MSGTTVSKHFVHELVAGSPRVTARPLGLRAQPAWVWVTWAADATEPSAETTITFAAPDSPVPVKPDAGLERLRDIRGAQRSSQAVRRPAPAMPAANPVPQADRDAATLAAIRLRISEGLAGRGGLDRPEADGATTTAPPEPDGAERPDTVRQLAHELRSPLAAISALADAIATEQFGPLANARYGEYARDIQATAGHALSVVAAMLERAPAGAAIAQPTLRSNGTTMPPPPTVTFDAGAIVAAAVRTYAPLAERADMRLSAVNQLGAIAAVIGEAHVLHQVLANLITNAIQHTP
ncbi:MAG: histidine kinase dimerization/phospho-acceptor domain-containing protein, partial [Pseudomonadota bacterium]